METILTLLFYTTIIFGTSYISKRLIEKRKKPNIIGLLVLISIISIIAAFRGNLGSDTQMYINAYQYGSDTIRRWVDFEIGFQLLMNTIRLTGMPYQFFFFVTNFLAMFFAFLVIAHERDNINVFMASFLCMVDFYFLCWNIIRQALAVSMCIYALCLYLDKKWKNAILLIILASLFHTSALICLAIIVAKYVFESKKYKLLLVVVAIVSLFLVFHRELIADIVYRVTHVSYYAAYFSRTADTEGSIVTYFLKILPIILIATLGYKCYEKNPKYKVLFSLMVLGYIFSSVGAITDTQVQRIGYYFTYLVWLVIGCVGNNTLRIGNHIRVGRKDIVRIVILFEIALFIFNRFVKGYGELVPYPCFDI